jgi:hypothetical protein
MRKLRISWTPKMEQDMEALCDPKSPFYDKKTADLLEELYQKHTEWLKEWGGKMEAYNKIRGKFIN